MCSPEAQNYFPKPGIFQNQDNFLFFWVFLRISSKCVDQNSANFRQKLGFMMSSVRIWDWFSLQPGKIFLEKLSLCEKYLKTTLGSCCFLSFVSSRICSKNYCRDKGHKTKYWGEILSVDLLQIKFGIWRVTFWKSFLPMKNYGMDFRFSGNNENIKCSQHLIQGIEIHGLK